ncbi:MAG: hypothetical protein ABIK37_03805 [candidate division WOR-3 bacterium]
MAKDNGRISAAAAQADAAAHALELRPDLKRRAVFFLLALLGVTAVILGIRLGDPETIHHFAAQI